MPEPQSDGSSRIYQLLFRDPGLHCAPTPRSPVPSEPGGSLGKDTHFGVDVIGATFGPSKGAKASNTPYSKGPAPSEANPKGKGVGQADDVPHTTSEKPGQC